MVQPTQQPNASNAKKLEKTLEDGRADAKKEFEEERMKVFDTLSESYKKMFGQIVFAKWRKESLPALILSPYNVPPGTVRNMWMDKFEKVRFVDIVSTITIGLNKVKRCFPFLPVIFTL
jgi:hypothetical protein